ncbi:hypothetical protein GCM10027456_08300 [Kineosporia babensis]
MLVSGLLLSLLAGQAAAASSSGPAHTLSAARKQAPVKQNSWQKAALGSKSQQNWYRLKVAERSYLYAMLGTLPADYNLRLYNDAGKQLNASDKSGTSAESIGRMVNPGTYFLRVASTKGYSKSKKYDLLARVAPASAGVSILTSQFGNLPSSTIVGEIVNASDQWMFADAVDIAYYDAKGKRLRKFDRESLRPNLAIAPGQRVPFQTIPGSIPPKVFAKVKSFKLTGIDTDTTSAQPQKSLKVSGVKKVRKTRSGLVSYTWTGKVTSASSKKAANVNVVVLARDRRGVVAGYANDWLTGLPAKSTRKFGLSYGNWRSGLTFSVKAYDENGLNRW